MISRGIFGVGDAIPLHRHNFGEQLQISPCQEMLRSRNGGICSLTAASSGKRHQRGHGWVQGLPGDLGVPAGGG